MVTFSPAMVIGLSVTLVVVGFWAVMFRDMATNSNLPDDAKNMWALAFIFFSLLTAAYYYINVYRPNHR